MLSSFASADIITLNGVDYEETILCESDFQSGAPSCIKINRAGRACSVSGGVMTCTADEMWETNDAVITLAGTNFTIVTNGSQDKLSGNWGYYWNRDYSYIFADDTTGSTSAANWGVMFDSHNGVSGDTNYWLGSWSAGSTNPGPEPLFSYEPTDYSQKFRWTFFDDTDNLTVWDNSDITNITPLSWVISGKTTIQNVFSKEVRGTCAATWPGCRTETMDYIKIATLTLYVPPPDTNNPGIYASINNSNPTFLEVINLSANVSDNIELSECVFFNNQTGTLNSSVKSVTGTSDTCSESINISVNGGVVNFTVRVSDAENNTNQSEFLITIIPDNSPPNILVINLTSEGGLGQIIFENDSIDRKQTNPVKTNDTTPTIRVTTNEDATCAFTDQNLDLNYTDMVATNASRECATTGGTNHICTLIVTESVTIGLHNFSVGCQDIAAGNENSTSTSGKFLINITDAVAPQIILNQPLDSTSYMIGTNNTITFNFSSTDNYDSVYNCSIMLDGVTEYINASYPNGTDALYVNTISTTGTHNWNVTCTDLFNNQNISDTKSFTGTAPLILTLDGVNASRKYEYLSIVNISANATGEEVCISLDAPGFGKDFECSSTDAVSFLYNISTLRQDSTVNDDTDTLSSSPTFINITMDNRSDLVQARFNLSSAGTSTNVFIEYYNSVKNLTGSLVGMFITSDEFTSDNALVTAANLTYIIPGSNFISVNVLDNPNSISFDMTGFNLDDENQLSFTEYFNITSLFNDSLSSLTQAPLGIFDDFVINRSIWDMRIDLQVAGTVSLEYENNNLNLTTRFTAADKTKGVDAATFYNSSMADFRNTTQIEVYFNHLVFCSRGGGVAVVDAQVNGYVTDGTSKVSWFQKSVFCNPGTTSTDTGDQNYSFIRDADNTDIYRMTNKGVGAGTIDLSSLDDTKELKFEFRVFTDATSDGSPSSPSSSAQSSITLYHVKWGGASLEYSTLNGTYSSIGNITSRVINRTATNVSKATLTSVEYKPFNTSIKYYLSNTCNSTIPTFEEVTPGEIHTFDTTGNTLCWRALFNSSDNLTTPLIRQLDVDVVPLSAENITVDLGDNGVDFTFTGVLNSTTSPVRVNLTPLFTGDQLIKISSDTAGQIQINEMVINSSVNPVILNVSSLEDCNDCIINFTFGGDDLTISDIQFDFLGSKNYTVNATSAGITVDEHVIQVKYSKFNVSIAKELEFYDVFAFSQSQRNISPFGQNDETPIWNITSQAYDERFDVYVRLENITNSCLNQTWSNSTDREAGINMTDSYQILCPQVPTGDDSCNSWNYIDLNSCTNRFEIPYFIFAATCSSCVLDIDDFSNYNLLTE